MAVNSIAVVWANRLVPPHPTKTWKNVPARSKDAVKEELQSRVEKGSLTREEYTEITGEVLV